MFPHGILLVPSSTVRSVGACNSRDYDGKVTPEEVGAAAALLRDSLCRGEEGVKELIQNLAKDTGVREAGVREEGQGPSCGGWGEGGVVRDEV